MIVNEPVETELVDPRRLGWQRHPTKPRVWVTDEGKLYLFPPNRPELIQRLKGKPPSLRRMA